MSGRFLHGLNDHSFHVFFGPFSIVILAKFLAVLWVDPLKFFGRLHSCPLFFVTLYM